MNAQPRTVLRRSLIGVILIGLLSALAGGPGYAAFSATTSNGANVIGAAQSSISVTSPVSSQGPVGSVVTVSGTGFPANAVLSATFAGTAVTVSGPASTDGAGGFTNAQFSVPSGTAASTPGPHAVVFTAGAWSSPPTTFTVTPSIAVSPSSAAAGTTITVTGSGFAANSTINTHTVDGVAVAL